VRLTIVGCSGSYPGPDSPASCYLLEEEHEGRIWRILLDMGNGSLGALHRYVDPMVIDAVFVSHLHVDHCIDLCSFYVLRKYHPSGPAPQIPVWGPTGTAARMARAYDLAPLPGMTEEFKFVEYAGAPIAVGPFTIEAVAVEHPVEAYSMRVEAGGSVLVYSGDTGPCDAFDEVAQGADLLLAEASFLHGKENPPQLHMTGRDCGLAATKAGVGRLVLTHIPPWYDRAVALEEARETYDGPIELAGSGARFMI
jgi:ribonuclease BN (tRNA processing enzyme)